MSEDLTHSLALLRGQRHSFMNHLQVVSGWLQLGKSERAIQYINRLAARMDAEGQVLGQVEPPVGIFILTMGVEAEPFGVTLEWQVTGPADPAQLDAVRDQVMAALPIASRRAEGERRLMITLGPSIRVHMPFVPGEG